MKTFQYTLLGHTCYNFVKFLVFLLLLFLIWFNFFFNVKRYKIILGVSMGQCDDFFLFKQVAVPFVYLLRDNAFISILTFCKMD